MQTSVIVIECADVWGCVRVATGTSVALGHGLLGAAAKGSRPVGGEDLENTFAKQFVANLILLSPYSTFWSIRLQKCNLRASTIRRMGPQEDIPQAICGQITGSSQCP